MAKRKKKKSKTKNKWLLWWIISILVGILTQRKEYAIILACVPIAWYLFKKLLQSIAAFIKRQNYRFSSLSEIDKMSGTEFEEFLQVHFRKIGYRVKHVGKTGDFGVDLILTDRLGRKTAVQAKRYNDTVGVKAIQEAVSGREYYGCYKAIVVTNSHFTKGAFDLANKCNIDLWDRDACRYAFSLKETRTYKRKIGVLKKKRKTFLLEKTE